MIALIGDRAVALRGADIQQLGMLSHVSVDSRMLDDHAIRKLRVPVGTILKEPDTLLVSRYPTPT